MGMNAIKNIQYHYSVFYLNLSLTQVKAKPETGDDEKRVRLPLEKTGKYHKIRTSTSTELAACDLCERILGPHVVIQFKFRCFPII